MISRTAQYPAQQNIPHSRVFPCGAVLWRTQYNLLSLPRPVYLAGFVLDSPAAPHLLMDQMRDQVRRAVYTMRDPACKRRATRMPCVEARMARMAECTSVLSADLLAATLRKRSPKLPGTFRKLPNPSGNFRKPLETS